MRKIREVLRLTHELGLSVRQVSEATGVGKTAVGEYIARAKVIGITWPIPAEFSDAELERRLFVPAGFHDGPTRPVPDWAQGARGAEAARRDADAPVGGASRRMCRRPRLLAVLRALQPHGGSVCRRSCGRRTWPATSCSSTGPATRSPSSIRRRARCTRRTCSSPHSARRATRTRRRAGRRRCPTGSARTSTRSTSSAACRRRRCPTISRPASPSRRATSRASIAPTRISPTTTASWCCRRASASRATRRRSRWPCRSSAATCSAGCATAASSRSTS